MTEESRLNTRRVTLLISVLFAAGFAAADWSFGASFRKYGTTGPEKAASGVAAMASYVNSYLRSRDKLTNSCRFVAVAVVVVDIWKICADASEARAAELFDQEQLADVEPFTNS